MGMAVARTLTGVEQTFADDEIIVSKTDTSGRITYANDVFLRICGYREDELLDQPHSMIRHPDMPRAVFKLLWDRISSGGEIFAFVVNCCRNGDHYWVLAHVTPDFDEAGRIVGYHSSRRLPKRPALAAVAPLYAKMLAAEAEQADAKAGMAASTALLERAIAASGCDGYDRFIFSLGL